MTEQGNFGESDGLDAMRELVGGDPGFEVQWNLSDEQVEELQAGGMRVVEKGYLPLEQERGVMYRYPVAIVLSGGFLEQMRQVFGLADEGVEE